MVSEKFSNKKISVNLIFDFTGMEVATQDIEGSTQWELSIAKGMITRTGHVQFTVQFIKVAFVISQSLNLEYRPEMVDLQLELGNIQIRSEGIGTADYLIEFFVNILPNMLRYQIMDALEKPVKAKIQEYLNKVDVEKLVREKVPELQKGGGSDIDMIELDQIFNQNFLKL